MPKQLLLLTPTEQLADPALPPQNMLCIFSFERETCIHHRVSHFGHRCFVLELMAGSILRSNSYFTQSGILATQCRLTADPQYDISCFPTYCSETKIDCPGQLGTCPAVFRVGCTCRSIAKTLYGF